MYFFQYKRKNKKIKKKKVKKEKRKQEIRERVFFFVAIAIVAIYCCYC